MLEVARAGRAVDGMKEKNSQLFRSLDEWSCVATQDTPPSAEHPHVALVQY